jgi:hypothetical protein
MIKISFMYCTITILVNKKGFKMETRFAYGTEITFINGEELHDFQMPSLKILANGEETEFYIIPFRAYCMNVLSHNNSYSNGMSDVNSYEEILKRYIEKYNDKEQGLDMVRIKMTTHIKEALESFISHYGKGGNITGLEFITTIHPEVDKFIKRCVKWIEDIIDGTIVF